MNKLKNTFITVVGVIVVCFIFSMFIPELREPFLFLLNAELLIVALIIDVIGLIVLIGNMK